MTLMEEAIERLRALPPGDRENAAETMLAIVHRYEAPSSLTAEQIEEVKWLESEFEAERLEFLSDEEVEETWVHRRA